MINQRFSQFFLSQYLRKSQLMNVKMTFLCRKKKQQQQQKTGTRDF